MHLSERTVAVYDRRTTRVPRFPPTLTTLLPYLQLYAGQPSRYERYKKSEWNIVRCRRTQGFCSSLRTDVEDTWVVTVTSHQSLVAG